MSAKAITILVVDDDAFVREMLATILEANGYRVITATNGREALETCRAASEIDLIVSDVNMPEMDGIMLIKTLREQQLDLPIIMVTSVSSISVAVDALSSGAIDYVLKDEGIQETIAITVKRALEKHQLKLQNIQLLADLAAKTSEQEETLSYLTAIINNMPDGLLVTNAQSRITLVNPALVTMLGRTEQELMGQHCSQVLPEQLAPLYAGFGDDAELPATTQLELKGGGTGSAVGAVIHRKQTAAKRQDECIGNLVIVRDVTSEKEIERMKDEFISTVSHELRTPLTSIIGFTRVIRKKLEEQIFPRLIDRDARTDRTVAQVSESIEVIIAEGERLTDLINDVLDLAKMEAGKIEWRYEPATVGDLIDRATAAISPLYEQKGLALRREIPADLPVITCDPDRIIQVVINLLSNALKFTDSGTVTIRAGVSGPGRLAGEGLRVTVIDTGIGIAEEDRSRVFEKFKQVGDTLTDRPKGTGLGLPICRQIVEYHGGVIWAEQGVEGGSIFAFELPCSPPSDGGTAGDAR